MYKLRFKNPKKISKSDRPQRRSRLTIDVNAVDKIQTSRTSSKRKGVPAKETARKEKKPSSYHRRMSRSPSKAKATKEATINTETNLTTLLDSLKDFNRTHRPDNDAVLALDALPHSKKHESHINKVLDDYIQCLACYKNEKWTNLLTEVRFDGPGSFTTAPKILVEIGGPKTNTKTQLANLSLIDWMAVTKKKYTKPANLSGSKLKMEGVPYYQPSTQNQRLRTFFCTVQTVFNWQYQLSDFDFQQGLTGFINKLYLKREQEFGKVTIYFNVNVSVYLKYFTTNVTLLQHSLIK